MSNIRIRHFIDYTEPEDEMKELKYYELFVPSFFLFSQMTTSKLYQKVDEKLHIPRFPIIKERSYS